MKIYSSKVELWTIFGYQNFTYICECSHLLLAGTIYSAGRSPQQFKLQKLRFLKSVSKMPKKFHTKVEKAEILLVFVEQGSNQ